MYVWDREADRPEWVTSAQGGAETQTEESSYREHFLCGWIRALVRDTQVTQEYLSKVLYL